MDAKVGVLSHIAHSVHQKWLFTLWKPKFRGNCPLEAILKVYRTLFPLFSFFDFNLTNISPGPCWMWLNVKTSYVWKIFFIPLQKLFSSLSKANEQRLKPVKYASCCKDGFVLVFFFQFWFDLDSKLPNWQTKRPDFFSLHYLHLKSRSREFISDPPFIAS